MRPIEELELSLGKIFAGIEINPENRQLVQDMDNKVSSAIFGLSQEPTLCGILESDPELKKLYAVMKTAIRLKVEDPGVAEDVWDLVCQMVAAVAMTVDKRERVVFKFAEW